ncbi:MAG: hypothetical protein ABIJ56_11295 [Pseudomonadota bacterium]
MKRAIRSVRNKYEAFEKNRSECIHLSGRLRAESKAAVNFLVRGEMDRGRQQLAKAPAMLKRVNGMLRKDPFLYSVPALNEGFEEYVEAVLLLGYIERGMKFPSPAELGVNHEVYIGGLCDMTGELVRIARGDPAKAGKIHHDVSSIYDLCIPLHVKRNNKVRSKLEDLERNIKRLEVIIYEQKLTSLR